MADTEQYRQEPIAIVGIACRLPGGNNTPHKLWGFLEQGQIASNKVPRIRFNINAFRHNSLEPDTTRPSGGIFLEDVDLAEFDASFFGISESEAISMDPNQRQLLEVVYEGLENAGITLDTFNGAQVGCFVASHASDYTDMQNRDPLDRPESGVVGDGRAILANRISHFLNIMGPSMSIDTACSGSLQGLDIAIRYLQTREIGAAIVAASSLYLNPEHVMDQSGIGAANLPSGNSHTFDSSTHGYVKSEAVSAVVVKRLSDAIRDRDPIRAVIRGSATNSNGRTTGVEAQAAAIRAAYSNAGISDLSETAYLECHGNGNQSDDSAEIDSIASVFKGSRPTDRRLTIGSIKSNVGCSGPSAGFSGIFKALLAIEKGVIPGSPAFFSPAPSIDFAGCEIEAPCTALPWPSDNQIRRASVNSFGFGGSNAHVILEQAPDLECGPSHKSSFIDDDDDIFGDEYGDEKTARHMILVVSANDEHSLKANIKLLSDHLADLRVKVDLADLAYTLSERRTQHFHRAFAVTQDLDIYENSFTLGKKSTEPPRIGFVFTGQGAQWPQMGKELIETFPSALKVLEELDDVLHRLPDPPRWSLVEELSQPRTAEHLRQPEFSQPLATALQLCIVSLLESWGIKPQSVVGHSFGEVAAAHAAGFLTRADAIRTAFYCGRAAVNCERDGDQIAVGMLAVGLGADELSPYLNMYQGSAWIACYNSPSSLTISGRLDALSSLEQDLQADSHFARLLQVNLAYHSRLMAEIGNEYEHLLAQTLNSNGGLESISMFSSVTGKKKTSTTDTAYWKANLVSPVRFQEAIEGMVSGPSAANFLIEIGPSRALAGPISQIMKSIPNSAGVSYSASWSRGQDAARFLFDTAGKLFVAGSESVAMDVVNYYDDAQTAPSVIIDLPNYVWNHSAKYWHESDASKDWRFKQFAHHDLLGSKIGGSPWSAPSFRRLLKLDDVPWLRDYKLGTDVVLPGAAYIAMAIEAMYQTRHSTEPNKAVLSANDFCYRLRNVKFTKALVIGEANPSNVVLSLFPQIGSKEWYDFRITSTADEVFDEHCSGSIRLDDPVDSISALEPLVHPTTGKLWYRAHSEAGCSFGPAFQRIHSVEARSGERHCRTHMSLSDPPSKWDNQSLYPVHPTALDGCIQSVTASLWAGERSTMNEITMPSIIDEVLVNKNQGSLGDALAEAFTEFSGQGKPSDPTSYLSNTSVYDMKTGQLCVQLSGIHHGKIDSDVVSTDSLHTFDRIAWKPDISFITEDQLTNISTPRGLSKAAFVIDLVEHKMPLLRVLEINLDPKDLSSLWFDTGDTNDKRAYTSYTVASPDAKSLVSLQSNYQSHRDTSFALLNLSKEGFGLHMDDSVDFLIVKAGPNAGDQAIWGNLRPLVSSDQSYVLFIPSDHSAQKSPSCLGGYLSRADSPVQNDAYGSETPRSEDTQFSEHSGVYNNLEKPVEYDQVHIHVLEALSQKTQEIKTSQSRRQSAVASGFTSPIVIKDTEAPDSFLVVPEVEPDKLSQNLHVARLCEQTPAMTSSLRRQLEDSGWTITEHVQSSVGIGSNDTILILDEVSAPLLTKVDAHQWQLLKELMRSGDDLLWVTKGSQLDVTTPDNALVHGLFRTVRLEDPNVKLATLDVQSSTGAATVDAIEQVLQYLRREQQSTFQDLEFAERNGVIYVHRVVPDHPINNFRAAWRDGAEPVKRSFHGNTVPMTQYGFDEVTSALTSIQNGHMGKIVISNGGQNVNVRVRPAIQNQLRSDASYLIVGGLEGVCGNLAVHMAIQGARKIIVLSQSGLQDDASQSGWQDDASQKVIMNCAARGCEVEEAKGNVTNSEFVKRVFRMASPQIAGVIQGTVTIKDKPFEIVTANEHIAAISDKIQGTWNLHNADLEQSHRLDFFTMLSSVSGIVGKEGQSSDTAANTFLDAFSAYRRSMGLCAHTVDLGPVDDVGYVVEQGGSCMDPHLNMSEMVPVLESTLRKILSLSILQQTTSINDASGSQMVTGIAYPLPNQSQYRGDARFAYQFAHIGKGSTEKEGDQGDRSTKALLLMSKAGADRADMVKAAVEVMSAQCTRVLRLDGEIEVAKPLMAYGLDSLAAVEIRNWARKALHADLTTLEITSAGSLVALCERLVAKLSSQ